MSPELERLVGRMVTDKEFRDKLLADPEGAVKDAGFQLTPDELDRVKAGVDNLNQSFTPDQVEEPFGAGQVLSAW